MNPLFTFLVAHTTARSLARTCGRCGRSQIVAQERAREVVSCAACGGPLPPKPAAR